MTLSIEVDATDGAARAATITTSRGSFATPCFMPVGTRGAVKTLSSSDLERLGFEVILSNTYHLMLRPGAAVVEALGGIHGFASWPGHVLTDSGGYQVFSLDPDVDDDGVTFRSTYDGSLHRFTPEQAVSVQQQIGADIQMVLDVCPPHPSSPDVLKVAVERTAKWAERARRAHDDDDQALFGIVQGGVDEQLRYESAEHTVAIGFDGYAIGGLSVGEPRNEMLPALDAAIDKLPIDRPRYLMGVGDPVGLVEAVARGVDMFDCVLPTRLARHGSALTSAGRVQLRNAAHATDGAPVDSECPCEVCERYSRAYLRHLLQVGEPGAQRLLTWHNLAWMLAFMHKMRRAVEDGSMGALRREVADIWD